jgi:trehalose/maltose hydrolase-like predicted phosphorylase
VNAIVSAQVDPTGCEAWTYTQRSLLPFVVAPYEQFTEARSGQGVFTFLTGEGGFLQEFLYGYSGLRWRDDGLYLAPSLPSQLAGGLDLVGVRWQGRLLDVHVRAGTTRVVQRSGPPMTVTSPAGAATLRTGHELHLATPRGC